jgi:branched-chain amino acid transport system substrate-binding protein
MVAQRVGAMPSSPLRIGVIGGAIAGIEHRAGTFNGGHGHEPSVELLVREGIADEASARDAVAGLLEAGVHGLISSSASWITLAVMDAADASCTPMVSTAPMAEVSRPYVFQAGPSQAQVDRALLTAVRKAGHTKAGLLSLEKLPTPESAAAAQGVVLTGVETFAASATSLAEPVKTLVAQAPDVLIVNAPPPYDATAVVEARSQGWTKPIFGLPQIANPDFHRVAGATAEGVSAAVPWIAAPSAAPPAMPNLPTLQRFVEAFDGVAGTEAGYGSDALSLLHLAFLGHRDRKAARDQLDRMCCLGVTGVYNMTPQNHAGLADDALVTMTSQGGGWVPVQG